jgi:TP901 family phage tail tape measure protein
MSQIRILLDLAAAGKLETSIQQLEQVRDAIKAATEADKVRAAQAIETNRKLKEGTQAAAKEEQKAAKEQEKLQKEVLRTTEKLHKENEKAIQEALRLAEKQRIAEEKKHAQLRAESTLIGQIHKQLREQRAIVAGAFDVKTIANANKEVERLSGEMRKLNNVGKASSNTFSAAFGSFQFKFNALGNLVGNTLFQLGQKVLDVATQIATDVVEIPAAFDKAADQLQSITGASAEDLEFYKQAAISLGPAVGKSATEVIKAYQLIGGAKPELLKNKEALTDFTKQVLVLSKASKEGLSESATELTDAMNQFGAPASEAARYINVLAAGSKEGAAEIPDLTAALLKFGVAAKSSNVSVEESTALIETLAEKGLKGADAGTALRNVLAKLSAPDTLPKAALAALKVAGVDIKKLSDTTVPFSARLEELSKIQGNASAITKVFGLENKIAGEVLINNRKRVEELTQAVTGTSTAYEQAAINTDNLAGDTDKAKAAYESLILSIDKGDGTISQFSRGVVQAFTRLVNAISGVKQENKDLINSNIATLQSTSQNIARNDALIKTYEQLAGKTKLTTEEKRTLNTATNELISSFGSSIAIIDKETGALTINIEAVKRKILLDKALQSEAAKNLIAEKLRLETALQTAGNAQEVFAGLRSQFEAEPVKNAPFLRIIDAARKGMTELNAEVISQRLAFQTAGDSSEQFENTLSAILPTLNRVSGSLFFQAKNVNDLQKVNMALLASGIDLDELAKQEIQTTTASGVAAGVAGKKKKEESLRELEYLQSRITLSLKLADIQEKLSAERSKISSSQDPELINKLKAEKERLEKLINDDPVLLKTELKPVPVPETKKLTNDLGDVLTTDLLDKVSQVAQFISDQINKKADAEIASIDKRLEQSKSLIDIQRQLAVAGKSNNLAFEIDRENQLLARREKLLEKQVKLAKMLAMIQLIGQLAGGGEGGNRDISGVLSSLKGIGVFERGGIAGEGSTQTREGVGGAIRHGVFQGRSHKQGGILIEAEGQEGILSRREMATLGKDNFYSLKDSLAAGRDFSQMLQGSVNQMLIVPQPKQAKNDEVVRAIQSLEREVRNIQSTHLEADELGNIVETRIAQGLRTVTTHKYKNSSNRKW